MPAPALVISLAVVGLFGFAVGSLVDLVVTRVPARVVAPVFPVRFRLVEFSTAVAFVAVTAWILLGDVPAGGPATDLAVSDWVAASLVLVAFLYLAAVSIALVLIDIDVHRLPNAIVMPSYPVGLALLGGAAALRGDGAAVARMLIGGGVLYLFYVMLRLIQPRGMGGGDVKLAGVLGMYLGWVGWVPLIVGALSAFMIGGLVSVVLMAAGRAHRRTAIAFGPFMLVGSWVGLTVGPIIAQWYLGLSSS